MPSIKQVLCVTATCFLLAPSISLAAQNKPSDKYEEQLIQFAHQSGKIAGGAQYCKMDSELIEEYIIKTNAKIAFIARDKYQKVLGRLEFKNIMTASSGKKPETSCTKIEEQLTSVIRDNRS